MFSFFFYNHHQNKYFVGTIDRYNISGYIIYIIYFHRDNNLLIYIIFIKINMIIRDRTLRHFTTIINVFFLTMKQYSVVVFY